MVGHPLSPLPKSHDLTKGKYTVALPKNLRKIVPGSPCASGLPPRRTGAAAHQLMVSSSGAESGGASGRTPRLEEEVGQDPGLLDGPTPAIPTTQGLGSAGDYLEDGSTLLFQDSFCDYDEVLRRNAGPGPIKPAPSGGGGAGGAGGGGGKGETVVCTLDYDRGMLPVLSLRQGRNSAVNPSSSSSINLTLNGGIVVPGPSYSLAPGTRLKVEGLVGGSSLVIKVRSGAGKPQLLRSRSLQREASGERMELQTSKSEGAVVIAGGEKSIASSTATTNTTATTTTTAAAPMDMDSTLRALRASEQQQPRKDRPAALASIKSTETGPATTSEEARKAGAQQQQQPADPEAAAKKAEADRERRRAARRAYVGNRAEFTAFFRSCLRTPDQISHGLADLPDVGAPAVVVEQLKWIMTPFLRQHTAVLQRLDALPPGSFAQFLAMTTPSGSVLYQERLLSALAKDLGVAFLCIDGLPAIKHDDVTAEGDGKASSATTAFPLTTPIQRHFKVGDRVLYQGTNSQLRQRTGRIISVPEGGSSSLGVRFDLPFSGGHSCGNLCEAPHGYFVMSVDIVLIEDHAADAKGDAKKMKDFSSMAALREALMNVALDQPELPIVTEPEGPLAKAGSSEASSASSSSGPLAREDSIAAGGEEACEAAAEDGEGGAEEECATAADKSSSHSRPPRPCIIFLPEMAELLSKAPPSTFKHLLAEVKSHVPIVVIAGFRSVKAPAAPPKKAATSASSLGSKLGLLGYGNGGASSSTYAVLDSVSAQGLDPQMVITFFPCQVAIEKPADPADAKKWEAMVEADAPLIRARRNVRRLRAGLHVVAAGLSDETATALLEHPLVQATSFRVDTLARLVLGACNIEAEASDATVLLPPPPPPSSAAAEGGAMTGAGTEERKDGEAATAEDKQPPRPEPVVKAASKKPAALLVSYASMDRALTLMLGSEEGGAGGGKKLPAKPLTTHEEELKESALISADQIGVGFDDVQLDAQVKERLQELIVLPLRKPHLFKRGNLTAPTRGVLLFGPPGTGKTSLAKAVATEVGANFISVNVSNMMSMWFGESEKYCKALFSLAVKLAPTIIFIDEVDALLGKRGGKEHEAMRKFKAEALAQWDGLTTSQAERVTVLGATNRPWDLDEAVLRRFSRRLYVKLPNDAMRERILQVMLKDEVLASDFDFSAIASDAITSGFSGSDLRNVCIAAAYKPLRDYLAQEKLAQELLQQAEEGQQQQQQAEADELARSVAPSKAIKASIIMGAAIGTTPEDSLRPLTTKDFLEAVQEVGASVAADSPEAAELSTWNEMYGEKGSRRKSATSISSMYL